MSWFHYILLSIIFHCSRCLLAYLHFFFSHFFILFSAVFPATIYSIEFCHWFFLSTTLKIIAIITYKKNSVFINGFHVVACVNPCLLAVSVSVFIIWCTTHFILFGIAHTMPCHVRHPLSLSLTFSFSSYWLNTHIITGILYSCHLDCSSNFFLLTLLLLLLLCQNKNWICHTISCVTYLLYFIVFSFCPSINCSFCHIFSTYFIFALFVYENKRKPSFQWSNKLFVYIPII